MEKEYVQRSGAPRGGRKRKKSGPPPFFIVALVLIVLIVAVVLAVSLKGRGGQEQEKEGTSAPSSAVSQTGEESTPSQVPSQPESQPESSSSAAEATPPPEQVPAGDPEKLSAFLKVGGTGYEYYNFVEDYAKRYIDAVTDGSAQLGSIPLYDVIVPTSMDVTLPESFLQENEINSSDQKKAIDWMTSSINAIDPTVKTVSIFDSLKLHNNEYLYFRTDHHWTQLGAYYAYEEFCAVKGVDAVPLESFEKRSYEGFLGSFYNAEPNSDMENAPDTVEAYVPAANASLSYTDTSGNTVEGWPVIQDGTGYDKANLYLIFCAADQPYEVIENSDLSDGSSCIVVKESFGNVFIPYLVNHYQTIYVVDYRYYPGDISDLAAEKGVDEVILINNISMTRNEDLISDLENTF